MEKISCSSLQEMIVNRKHFILINTLDRDSYVHSHIPGSINVPSDDSDFEQIVQKIIPDVSEVVVVYCANYQCTASETAAKKLEGMEYKNIFDFEDGLKSWDEAGYPMVIKK